MTDPVVAQKGPFEIDVESGRSYFWCACGRSGNQPFCDGSHKSTDIVPVKFDSKEDRRVFFCGCKQSASAPICDGSHNMLRESD
ncbi:MAG: CDGSH iron-sulfur domain-containing protein [Albidovulum sp.]|nr:CDGSH iron-sulfur domain-containing protein [Albidovulum sp.]MDE0307592.1 CDGSH iron-sulfur domain-containing protein [Albidovulum sp.]